VNAMEIRDLTVRYGRTTILSDISLSVPTGEWMAVIGPNGAGKTTLLRAIAGLVRFEGKVALDGVEVSDLRPKARARMIAIVPQRPVLPPSMSVLDYVLLGRTPYIRYFDTETKADIEVVRRSLERLGISVFADRSLGSLSGGEQQRVVLARAIAQEAPTLLLDEGTSALDVGSQQQVLELVESLRVREGFTVLSAMHDLTLAGQFGHSLALISAGQLVAVGAPADVLNEDTIAAHYGATVRVMNDADGIVVAPIRRSAGRPAGRAHEVQA
jgi:iron complex transport system ATP-binding protein